MSKRETLKCDRNIWKLIADFLLYEVYLIYNFSYLSSKRTLYTPYVGS